MFFGLRKAFLSLSNYLHCPQSSFIFYFTTGTIHGLNPIQFYDLFYFQSETALSVSLFLQSDIWAKSIRSCYFWSDLRSATILISSGFLACLRGPNALPKTSTKNIWLIISLCMHFSSRNTKSTGFQSRDVLVSRQFWKQTSIVKSIYIRTNNPWETKKLTQLGYNCASTAFAESLFLVSRHILSAYLTRRCSDCRDCLYSALHMLSLTVLSMYNVYF